MFQLLKRDEISGFVFGQDYRKIIFEKEDKNGNILVMGEARSGKSYNIMCSTLMTWKGKVFVIDRAGELYEKAKTFRDEKEMIQIDIDKWESTDKENSICDDLQHKDIFIKVCDNNPNTFKPNKLREILILFLDYYYMNERSVSIPILFLFDNMEIVPQIEHMVDYLKLKKTNLKICMSWQSTKQMLNIYGEENTYEIIKNCKYTVLAGHIGLDDFKRMMSNTFAKRLSRLERNELAVAKLSDEDSERLRTVDINGSEAVKINVQAVNYYLKIDPEKLSKRLHNKK